MKRAQRNRTLVIDRRLAGRTVAELMRAQWRMPTTQVQESLRRGLVLLAGQPCTDGRRRVRAGQHLALRPAGPEPRKPPDARAKEKRFAPGATKGIVVHYLDEHILVVEKPAGLTTVRHAGEIGEHGAKARRYLPPTLVDVLPAVLEYRRHAAPDAPRMGRDDSAKRYRRPKGRIRAVHRLDRDTSGLVVLALTPEAERHLGLQFRAHSVERTYLAVVRGRAKDQRIESHVVEDRGDGRRGSSADPKGKLAVTHVRVVEKLGACSLVECRLETGRTHQVRIHLGEAGTPLCGERVYDRPLHGKPLPDPTRFARPALHAATLGLVHPVSGARLHWSAPLPPDMSRLLHSLRRSSSAQ